MPSYWGCFKKNSNRVDITAADESGFGMLHAVENSERYESIDETFKFETAFLNPDCYEKLSPEIETKEIEQ